LTQGRANNCPKKDSTPDAGGVLFLTKQFVARCDEQRLQESLELGKKYQIQWEVQMMKSGREASFIEKLTTAIRRNNSLLCVGLDPDLGRIPKHSNSDEERLIRWGTQIIDQTADLVCCYKPNFAFYEQYGVEGLSALRKTIAAIPDNIPVLLDAKRGDIGHTAAAYARAAFEIWGVDAITISPYLGRDSVVPFLAYEGKSVFLLCHTSNPSAAEIQHFGQASLYRHVAWLGQTWGDANQIGFVVGATQPEALAQVRAMAPDCWLLAPGIGAQGGDLAAAMAAGLDVNGGGVIIPVSRSVIYAADPRKTAVNFRNTINQHRPGVKDGAQKTELILELYKAGCVQFGEFTLSSGKQSPVYVDLRRIASYPALFQRVVNIYANLIRPLQFDCLAAVPYAALPLGAAIALKMNRSLIYPRKVVKTHGTGRAIEGVSEKGDTAIVIEDVVSSGGSLFNAIETLEAADLIVRDAVVLVEREQGGLEAVSSRGYRLHYALTMSDILDVLRNEECISAQMHQTVKAYVKESYVSN
jgi:uridine monophosphate synthetase